MATKKVSLTLDDDILVEAQKRADAHYGGNLSRAINEVLKQHDEMGKGPMSKYFLFQSEVRTLLSALNIKSEHTANAIDWVLPKLRLGIEIKTKFTAGKAESATVASMAFSVGQNLVDEIWIVGPDSMGDEDRQQWDRVAREFHLCRARFVLASQLEAELKRRMVREPSADQLVAQFKKEHEATKVAHRTNKL